jgi:hypothetical protein
MIAVATQATLAGELAQHPGTHARALVGILHEETHLELGARQRAGTAETDELPALLGQHAPAAGRRDEPADQPVVDLGDGDVEATVQGRWGAAGVQGDDGLDVVQVAVRVRTSAVVMALRPTSGDLGGALPGWAAEVSERPPRCFARAKTRAEGRLHRVQDCGP